MICWCAVTKLRTHSRRESLEYGVCVCVCVCVCVREQTCCNLRDREYTQVLQRQNGDTAILHDRLTGVDEVYARSFGNGLTLILHRLM